MMLRIAIVSLAALFAACETPVPQRATWTPGKRITNPQPADMEKAASTGSQAVGRPAPPFSLLDHTGKPVSLADYRGKWLVLYFYPQNDTPGCVCQATKFTGLLTQYRYMNADVLGVSPDTVKNHKYFREKYSLGITLLSDPQHQAMTHYGAWANVQLGGEVTGRVIRSTYIIDPAGRIAWHWPEVIPKGHADRVKAKLTELAKRS